MSRSVFRRRAGSDDSPEARGRDWDALIGAGRQFHLVHGRETFIVHTRDPIGRDLYVHGEYDFGKVERSLGLLGRRSAGTLVDIGANIGSVCIPAVARGIAERAIAVEPEPVNCAMLRANVAMNGLNDRITCFENALGAHDDREVLLELSEENKGDHRIEATTGATRGRRSVAVQMRRLDSLVPSLDPDRDLIFMDVQGFEKFVLDGAGVHLASRVPIAMELWPEGMMEHCTFDDLFDVIGGYSHFYDLNLAPAPVLTPLGALRELWDGYIRGDVGFGDILLVQESLPKES